MKRGNIAKKTVIRVAVNIVILIIAALFLTWLLEYRYFINNADDVWTFVRDHSKIYLYNSLIMLTILGVIYGLVRKIFLSISIGTAAVLIFGYIHIAKFGFRGTPLLPEDFQMGSQTGTLTKFIDMSQVVRLIIAVILVIILGIIIDRLTKKWLGKESTEPSNPWWRRYRIISRIAIIAVSICGFMITTDFIRHHGRERDIEIPILDSHFTDWNQVTNYSDNGFLIGFLYNTTKLAITEPGGYSKDKMKEIDASLTEMKQAADVDRINIADAGYNVIIVLDESFYDPSIIADYYKYSGGDVTPNLHRLQENNPSGYLFSPDYGGGTANIEFETLTGLTNYWLKTVPYTNLITKQKSVPSLASYMKSAGLHTVAIHPFVGGMYKREEVLPRFGFDEFIDIQDFSDAEHDGSSEYVNDRTTYNKTLDYIKNTPEKDFVSVITMQNHAPYIENEYGDPKFIISGIDNEAEKSSAETYMMSLNKSDQYLGEFIDNLGNFEEKTIVLAYGDHAPGVYSSVLENENPEISNLVRLTPFILYANFDTESEPVKLPTTTPNCLGNFLLNYYNLQKPANYYLLDTVCEQTPILTDIYFGSTAPAESTELGNYNLLTYDLTAGKQYILK